jgi:hypothetical protein
LNSMRKGCSGSRTSSNFDLGSRQGSSMVLAGYLGSTASSPEGQWANVAQPDLSSSLNVPNPHRNFLKSVTPKFLSLSPQRFRLNAASRSYSRLPQTPPKFSTCLSLRSNYWQTVRYSPENDILTATHIHSYRLPIVKFYTVKRPLCLAEDEAVAGDVVVAVMAPISNMMMKSSQSCPLRQSQNPCFRYTKNGRRCGSSSDISALGFPSDNSQTSVPFRTCVGKRISTLPRSHARRASLYSARCQQSYGPGWESQ